MPTRAPSYRPASIKRAVEAHARESDRLRGSSSERGYGTAWRNYTAAFLAEHPACACGCNHPATCVDHVIPIDGPDDPLFWAPANHEGLTHDCHTRKTKRCDPLIRALRSGASTAKWSLAEVNYWRDYMRKKGLI